MNVNLLSNPRRLAVVLATAVILAMTASSASVLLDKLAGTSLTPAVYACEPQDSGCG